MEKLVTVFVRRRLNAALPSVPHKIWGNNLASGLQWSRKLASESSTETPDNGSNGETSPTGLMASQVMAVASNRATRFVYLRTLPLAQRMEFSGREKQLGDQIEATTEAIVTRHLSRIIDDRAAVHVHTAALAVASKQTLGPFIGNSVTLDNIIRAGFGAPLLPDKSSMSEEDLITLNDDQRVRPDYWIVRFALWLAFDKMAAVRRMTDNMVNDFGSGFKTSVKTDELVGMPRHTLFVHKCLYNDVCKEEGEAELTRIFCALDRSIYSPINSDRHRVRFTLEHTLADDGKAEIEPYNAESDATGGSYIDKIKEGGDSGKREKTNAAACEFRFLKVK